MKTTLSHARARRVTILLITAVIHIVLIFTITFDSRDKQEREEPSVFRLVDIQEVIPEPEPQRDVIEVATQAEITEEVIEVEQEVVEVDPGELEYLPQYRITAEPRLPADLIESRIEYPQLANRQGIEGLVLLELYIDTLGNIRRIEVLRDPGHGFAGAAVKAFEGIVCEPAYFEDTPVAVRFRYPVNFRITR